MIFCGMRSKKHQRGGLGCFPFLGIADGCTRPHSCLAHSFGYSSTTGRKGERYHVTPTIEDLIPRVQFDRLSCRGEKTVQACQTMKVVRGKRFIVRSSTCLCSPAGTCLTKTS